MVSRQAQMGERTQQIATLVRVRTIPDHVPQTPDVIPIPLGIFQNSLKRSQIGMNVGNDENSHTIESLSRTEMTVSNHIMI